MKRSTTGMLTIVFIVMLLLLPFVVPSGAITTEAKSRYLDSMTLDDEFAFLNDY